MLTGLAQTGMKALGGARFSLVNVTPAMFLVGFWILLATSGLYAGDTPDLGGVVDRLGGNAGLAIVAVFGVFVLAVLLRPFQAALVHVLEGYWEGTPVINHAAALATERHRRILHTAKVIGRAKLIPGPPAGTDLAEVVKAQQHSRLLDTIKARAGRTFERYPEGRRLKDDDGVIAYDDRLMPTMLGNVLREGEDTAGGRYGLALEVVASRLWPSLSSRLAGAIRQNLDLIDTAAAMCLALAIAALSSMPLIGRGDWWSLLPLATAALSVLAYRGAIRVGRSHGRLLATAFDLHRFDMLAALHYELPTNTAAERGLNQQLSIFLANRNSADYWMSAFPYVHSNPAPVDQGDGEPAEPGSGEGGSGS